jgi:quercetin dioxygenase-like cupin family protein
VWFLPEAELMVDRQGAEVVLPCTDLPAAAEALEHLGFRTLDLWPADDPRCLRLEGHGLRLRLERGLDGPASLALPAQVLEAASLPIPGLSTALRSLDPPPGVGIELPALRPALVITRGGEWGTGRAGMRYRDLIGDRQGGRFIASHIRIDNGGPVPDRVHFHELRFQMIYCLRGWVRVAYQDQGSPLRLEAGDAFLQPPGIRHRVLEASAGLEVLELASPAEHLTGFDPGLELGSSPPNPGRTYGGQTFVFHRASETAWVEDGPWQVRDLGLTQPTGGLARVRVLRCAGAHTGHDLEHTDELLFRFVVAGALTLRCAGHGPQQLGPGDACVVPPGMVHGLEAQAGSELLEVSIGAV